MSDDQNAGADRSRWRVDLTPLRTSPDFKVKIPVVGKCELRLDTTRKGAPDIGLVLPVLAALCLTAWAAAAGPAAAEWAAAMPR